MHTGAAFGSLADVEALERTPYEQAIPVRTTYGLIARAAAQFPQRDAFVFLPDGELATPPQRVTYAELLAHIHRAANLFRSLGVGPDDSVEGCMALMSDKHVRHLPVVEADTVIGLVSIGDVVKALLHEQQFFINQLERYITA